jgi:hypothetical protein
MTGWVELERMGRGTVGDASENSREIPAIKKLVRPRWAKVRAPGERLPRRGFVRKNTKIQTKSPMWQVDDKGEVIEQAWAKAGTLYMRKSALERGAPFPQMLRVTVDTA